MQLSLVAVLDKAYHKWMTNANWVDPYKAVPGLTAKRSNWFTNSSNSYATNREQKSFDRFQMDVNLFSAGKWLKGVNWLKCEHWRANCYNFYTKEYILRQTEQKNSTAKSQFIRVTKVDNPFKEYIY